MCVNWPQDTIKFNPKFRPAQNPKLGGNQNLLHFTQFSPKLDPILTKLSLENSPSLVPFAKHCVLNFFYNKTLIKD